MASRVDDTIAALAGLGAPGPFVTGTINDRQRNFLLAKTGLSSGSYNTLYLTAFGAPVKDIIPANLVVLP